MSLDAIGWSRSSTTWRLIALRYLPALAVLNLAWEVVQLPLYTLWYEDTPSQIAFAVAHCTVGDLVIGVVSLIGALAVTRSGPPESWVLFKVALLTVFFAGSYTIFSEWLNTNVRHAWAYSNLMPVVPVLGTGLSPLLQWAVIPTLALVWSLRPVRHRTPPLGERL